MQVPLLFHIFKLDVSEPDQIEMLDLKLRITAGNDDSQICISAERL